MSRTYKGYCASVAQIVNQGLTELGFNTSQSIGYARGELEYAIDKFPEDGVMIITALMICAGKYNHISTYQAGDGYFDDIEAAYNSGEVAAAAARLPADEKDEFLNDVAYVKQELRI
jgi:hypothetical protein